MAGDREGGGTVVIIAATNRLQDLDEAILRRFDAKVSDFIDMLCEISLVISLSLRICG
jgi:AAA+ superfamily predicted ATPase